VPSSSRLEVRADGSVADAWTGRILERAPLTDATLARARAFARADHAGLQTVLRVDRVAGAIWLEATGAPVERALTDAERGGLRAALEALHANGAVHGRVDTAHVVEGPSGALLRFQGDPGPTDTADRDLLALARLR
jgi:serine/threonine-protein kinase